MTITSRTLSRSLAIFLLISSTVACNLPIAAQTSSPSPVQGISVVPVHETRMVIADQATLRAGPGLSYAKVGSLSRGSEIMVIGRSQDGEWYQLRLADSRPGEAWLLAEFTAPQEPGQAETATQLVTSTVPSTGALKLLTSTPSLPLIVTVFFPGIWNVTPITGKPMITTSRNINCLAGTNKVFAIQAVLSPGVSVEVRGRSPDGQWWYIQNPDKPAKSCWVRTNTVVMEGDPDSIPIVEPLPIPTAILTLVPPAKPTRTSSAQPPVPTTRPILMDTPILNPTATATLAKIDTPTVTFTALAIPTFTATLAGIDTPTVTSTALAGPTFTAMPRKIDTPTPTFTAIASPQAPTPIETP